MRATPVVGHTRPAIAPSVTLPGFGKVSSPVNVQRFCYSYIYQSGIFSRRFASPSRVYLLLCHPVGFAIYGLVLRLCSDTRFV